MSPLLLKTLRDLLRARWRTLGLAFMVAAGVGLVAGGDRAGVMMRRSLDQWRADLRGADLEVSCPPLPPERLTEAFPIPGVAAFETRLVLAAGLERQGRAPLTALLRTLPETGQHDVDRLHVLAGRLPEPDERAAIVDRSLEELHGIGLGSTIVLLLEERRLEVPVVGIAVSPEHLLMPTHPNLPIPMPGTLAVVFLRPPAMRELVPTDRQNSLVVRYEAGADPKATEARVLDALTFPVSEATPASRHPDVQVARMATAPFDVYMPTVSFVQGLICLLLLVVALMRVVEQERMRTGVLLALGYRRRRLLAALLVHGLVPTTVGIAIGALIHPTVAREIYRSYAGGLGYPPARDPGPTSALAEQAALYVAVGLLACLLPAVVMTRERLTVMLRPRWSQHEPRGGFVHRLFDRVVNALRIPLSVRMGGLGTLRRYRSTVGALIGIGASFTVLLAFIYVHVTHRIEVDRAIERWNPGTTVHYEHPVETARLEDLATRTQGTVEPCLSRVMLLEAGDRRTWCRTLGVELDGHGRKLDLAEGRPLGGPTAREVLLDPRVAAEEGVGVGDRVVCFAQADALEGEELEVVGLLDGLSLGLAVLPIETAQALASLPGLANTGFVESPLGAQEVEARAWEDPDVQTVLTQARVVAEVSDLLNRTDVVLMWGLVGAAIVATLFLGVLSSLDAHDRGPEMLMLQALGWRDRSLWAVGVTETVGRGLLAILLAGVGGPVLGHRLLEHLNQANHYRLELIVPGWVLGLLLLLSLCFLPLGAVPALRAIRRSRIGSALRELSRD